jgi:phosphoglucomutase
LLYELDSLDWFCIRPSGTEPKIKIYFGVYGDAPLRNEDQLRYLRDRVEGYVRSHL